MNYEPIVKLFRGDEVIAEKLRLANIETRKWSPVYKPTPRVRYRAMDSKEQA